MFIAISIEPSHNLVSDKNYKEQSTSKEIRNVFQLRDIIFSIATIADEQRKHMIVLTACMGLIQFC